MLAIRLKRIDDQERSTRFLYALTAEIDHANKVLSLVLAFLEEVTESPLEYRFAGDPLTIQFKSQIVEKYDYTLLVYPQTVYRVVTFFGQIEPILASLDPSKTSHFTEAGHRFLVGLLRYGISLAIRLERSLHQRSIDETQEISVDEVISHFEKFRFPGGGTYLKSKDFRALMEKYPQVRF